MSQQVIQSFGYEDWWQVKERDGGGDLETLKTAFAKVNANFAEVYATGALGGATAGAGSFTTVTLSAALKEKYLVVTYVSLSTIAINAALANTFSITITDDEDFDIGAPTNPTTGQKITLLIRNGAGAPLGADTWDAAFKMAAFVAPADGTARSITFVYDGTYWVELERGTVDVPV